MDSNLFRRVGEALFGSRWQTDLAGALNLSDRTVRRLAAGTHEAGEGLRDDLRKLVSARRKLLAEVERELRP
jgi:hypothetical protein